MKRKTLICTLNISADETPLGAQPAACPTRRRLAEAFSLLEKIQPDRAYRRDSPLCRLVEDRMVWRELLELELQEADEQIKRISKAAGDVFQS
jgi:hypothetical protein